MRVSVAPFHLPDAVVATHSGWTLGGDSPAPLPRLIEAWDYQGELRIVGGLSVDIEALCAQSRIDRSSQLQVLVIARSSSTKVERCVLKWDLPDLEYYELRLEVSLSGDWLGGRLTLDTMIVATLPIPLALGAAKEPGSILWTVRQDAFLEGLGGLFPTDTEDFAETRPSHRDAPWVLTVDQGDFDSLFAASVRLTLNTGVAEISKMLADPTREDSARLASILELDVTRQLAFLALGAEEVLARSVEPDGVVLGDVLRLLVARIWPTASTASLRGWCQEHPERVELDIQQFVRAFK